eukprot:Hpha_TRINITY_DN15757_c2_g10::TRINITY_DN15757_c2_g10_i1::g.37615::m.37615
MTTLAGLERRPRDPVDTVLERRLSSIGLEQEEGRPHPCLAVPERVTVVAVAGQPPRGQTLGPVGADGGEDEVGRGVDSLRELEISGHFDPPLLPPLLPVLPVLRQKTCRILLRRLQHRSSSRHRVTGIDRGRNGEEEVQGLLPTRGEGYVVARRLVRCDGHMYQTQSGGLCHGSAAVERRHTLRRPRGWGEGDVLAGAGRPAAEGDARARVAGVLQRNFMHQQRAARSVGVVAVLHFYITHNSAADELRAFEVEGVTIVRGAPRLDRGYVDAVDRQFGAVRNRASSLLRAEVPSHSVVETAHVHGIVTTDWVHCYETVRDRGHHGEDAPPLCPQQFPRLVALRPVRVPRHRPQRRNRRARGGQQQHTPHHPPSERGPAPSLALPKKYRN